MEKSAHEMKGTLFGKEDLVSGIVSAPLRALGVNTDPDGFLERTTRSASELLSSLRRFGIGGTTLTKTAPKGEVTSFVDTAKAAPTVFATAAAGELSQDLFGWTGKAITDAALLFAIPGASSLIKSGGKRAKEIGAGLVENIPAKSPERTG